MIKWESLKKFIEETEGVEVISHKMPEMLSDSFTFSVFWEGVDPKSCISKSADKEYHLFDYLEFIYENKA